MADSDNQTTDIIGKLLGGDRARVHFNLPQPVIIALARYAALSRQKPETIVAEALRAYLGDAA
jgi:hypothetical protein